MSNNLKRGLSGLVYALLFIAAILYSEQSYLFLTYFFGLACLREFLRLIRLRNYFPYLILSGLTYLILFERDVLQGELVLLLITLSASVQLLVSLYLKQSTYPNSVVAKFDITIRYLILSFTFLLLMPFYDDSYHPQLVLAVIIMIWTNDTFAFLIGKNFGNKKLFPSVSPKKTIEGFVGGVVFTLLAAYLIFQFSEEFSLLNWMILGLIASVIGTFGDLVESKFKRQAKVKDSGHIMPGHGGLLDRLDSLFFVAPFVYLYIHYLI